MMMLEHSETIEAVGFALHAERLAQAERHQQVREAEHAGRQVGQHDRIRKAIAQALLAVAMWLTPEVVAPTQHATNVTG